MIKKIIRCLRLEPQISDWIIEEKNTLSTQAFYVLENLETTRKVKTTEYNVTIYTKFQANSKEYLGSSSFQLPKVTNIKSINQAIKTSLFAAGFVENEPFEIVENTLEKKKTFKEKELTDNPLGLLDDIALAFFKKSEKDIRFNAFEAFYNENTTHIVNSKGVDLKKTTYNVAVEAIPSFDSKEKQVEIYKNYHYNTIDFDIISEDAIQAISDVKSRYYAINVDFESLKENDQNKIDIILKDQELNQFFGNLISDYSYASVYREANKKKIGDYIQEESRVSPLTIGLKSNSKANAFDSDGVILKPVTVVEDGKVINYYGNNRYAKYLNIAPTGSLNMLSVKNGKTSINDMKKGPYIEIIALSMLQIDMYSDYIGGEVRLANYFDGKEVKPISGFSFSGSINGCLNSLVLSKEKTTNRGYEGPKYIKLVKMSVL